MPEDYYTTNFNEEDVKPIKPFAPLQKLFIVFEGLDGSGTSTQSALLAENLHKLGISCFTTAEPTNSPIGGLIRKYLGDRSDFYKKQSYNNMLLNLFKADRELHLYSKNGIDSKKYKDHVICTRYLYSSLAYNCENNHHIDEELQNQRDFRKPDIVFYLDISPDDAIERLKERKKLEVYENKSDLSRVHDNYKYIFSTLLQDTNVVELRATKSKEHLSAIILGRVLELL